MQVFLHRNTSEEECYLNVEAKRLAVQNKKDGKMTLKTNVPQVRIDRYYADALAGENGWEVMYVETEDKQAYPI